MRKSEQILTLFSQRAAGGEIAAEEDLIEWTFEGERKQGFCFGVCETEETLREQRSAYESTSERAWKHVKRGGTAGYDFYSCPGKLFAVAGFLFFREVFVMFLFTKLWRRRADENFILKENKI